MLYMPYRLAAVLVVGSALLVTGCDDDDTTQPQQFATVRFVNASSATTGSVTPQVGGQALPAGANITGFQQASQCVNVPVTGSSQTITFTSGGQTINLTTPAGFHFQANQKYTVVLVGTTAGNRQAIVLTDPTVTAATDSNAIRFINAFGQTGSVFSTTASGTFGGTANVANLQSGQASTGGVSNSGFIGIPTTNTRLGLFTGTPSQTNQTPQAQFTLQNNSLTNRVGTIVFTPAPQGGTATGFVVTRCS